MMNDDSGELRKSTQDEPDEKHRYVGGVDWGQTDDYTALSIIDATTNEEDNGETK
ncbi:hypothetical protein LCGC14_1297190 [marine sediment metagenome]|uniref:Uncharacterized protein n=1 Tax=marine sediment metagenome TaxID=412755 RepID=A0A0F9KSB2_9ZZZZ